MKICIVSDKINFAKNYKKILVEKINYLENRCFYKACEGHLFWKKDDKPINLKPGMFYYIITGQEQNIKNVLNNLKVPCENLADKQIYLL